MKHDLIDNIISQNNKKGNPNSCSICKCEKLPIDFAKNKNREIKMLKDSFKFKEDDFSILIKKCNCTKSSPKSHKLCILLNILYNFNLKCPECNTDYNIIVKQHKNTGKNLIKICSLIFYLFINIIIYGASAFLILYPLIINKNTDNDPEKRKFEHFFYFFGGLLFILNTFFIYVTISSILCNNPEDVNDYTIDIKDINEPNKNKNSDKHYILLYKFYRYFYKTQIRFLISKKHKHIYIAKGYGYFNKELQDLIIKNNLECEKENILYNGGEDILNLNNNKNKNKINNLDDNNKHKYYDQSNGNIENNNDNIKRPSTLNEEKRKNKEDNYITKNQTQNNLPKLKNNNVFRNAQNDINKEESNKKNNDIISNNSSKNTERDNKNKKKIIIEVINTDKQIDDKKKVDKEKEKENENEKENVKNSQKGEIKSKEDNDNLNLSKNSENSIKFTKISKNSKNSKISISNNANIPRNKLEKNIQEESKNNSSPKLNEKNKDKKYIESTELFKNDGEGGEKLKIEEDKISKKALIDEEQGVLEDDNFNIFISSPFHNNAK